MVLCRYSGGRDVTWAECCPDRARASRLSPQRVPTHDCTECVLIHWQRWEPAASNIALTAYLAGCEAGKSHLLSNG